MTDPNRNSPAHLSRFHLVVLAGPDRGLRARLDGASLTIGRATECGLQLSDGAVSRRHMVVAVEDCHPPKLVIRELTGTNPVWMVSGGQKGALELRDQLAAGSSFTLGNTTLSFGIDTDQRGTIELDARPTPNSGVSTRLESLSGLGERLSQCSSLRSVYRTATEWALCALNVSRALLLNPDGSDILGSASEDLSADLALSQTLMTRVLGEQRAFLVKDVNGDPELASRRSVQIRGVQGAMAAPVDGLIFYVEWGTSNLQASRGEPLAYDNEALTLLVCAAHLVSALGRNARERQELKAASRITSSGDRSRLIGDAPEFKKLVLFLEKVAATPATVLINGESGTGKELAANMLHMYSTRCDKPFVALNCAAIPETLLESELFGHDKGAFTGAVAQHKGVFERAHTGTLFLDEIGEMSLQAQVRLLRVLEVRTLTRVGGTVEIPVDVRLVTATHRNLEYMVELGTFRADLFFRLKVLQAEIPPLRNRKSDIPMLAMYFAKQLGESLGRRVESVSDDALRCLTAYPWPGNVRELRNVIERALVLGDGDVITLDDLAPELTRIDTSSGFSERAQPVILPPKTTATPSSSSEPAPVVPLEELERNAIQNALLATEGNKARAAGLLGIDRSTLYRKLRDLQI